MATNRFLKALFVVCSLFFILFSCEIIQPPPQDSGKQILSFRFTVADNDTLPADVDGAIDEENKTIDVRIPFGIKRDNLVPSIDISENATVLPASDQSIDFTNPIKYTVTAQDGSTEEYTVTVTNKEYPQAKIIEFKFLAADNPMLTSDVVGEIDAFRQTVLAVVPCGVSLTSLKPHIVVSEDATVAPLSGVARDFSSETTYTISAMFNVIVAPFKITVRPETEDRAVLREIFNANPGNLLGWDLKKPVDTWSGVKVENCKVVELILSDAKLTTIPPPIGLLKSLRLLQITYNDITSLPPEVGNLTEIKTLQLSYNKLTALTDEICNLPKLEALIAESNLLTGLPNDFSKLSDLYWFNVADNKITALPEGISEMIKLEGFNVNYNLLTTLPSQIGKLSNLESVVAAGNNLQSLPAGFGNLKKLKTLILARNNFTTLPAEIGNLSSLTELIVHLNQLASLPAEIGNLSNLNRLLAQSNKLTSLPPEIGNLTNLWEMNLEDNELSSLPKDIGELDMLVVLQLKDNSLTTLPIEIGDMTSLINLNVQNNALTSVPAGL